MLPCPKIVPGQKELTPQQVAYARRFAQERIAAMLSTESIDEQEAERHLREAYRIVGIEPPTTIRWFDSPLAFVLASVPDSVWEGLRVSVWDRMWARVWDRVQHRTWANVGDHVVGDRVWDRVVVDGMAWNRMQDRVAGNRVRARVWDRVEDSMRDNVRNSMRNSVEDSVEASVWDNVRARVRASVGARLWDRLPDYLQDSVQKEVLAHDWDRAQTSVPDSAGNSVSHRVMASVLAYYMENHLVFYQFFHEVFEENRLIHLARFNEMVSGYHLGSKEAWLVRKPMRLERDEQGRLHSTDGMCLQYRDGWGLYAWHGVRVSEQIIMRPERLTKKDWMAERNLEARRVIQERLGNERFVELMGGKCIDKGKRGRLIEVNLGSGPERMAHYVHVQDSSTQRQYYLRVPPSITSADEAIAWTFGLDARDYQPGQET